MTLMVFLSDIELGYVLSTWNCNDEHAFNWFQVIVCATIVSYFVGTLGMDVVRRDDRY